ncbi:SRPBCC family protein [Arthrobacter sp. NPDC057259]|uniref:SRPBCC family protein n=1 Tax=Arthrobacter sp. NPDC057259 TaxID=3346073 RepID=UPI00363C712C
MAHAESEITIDRPATEVYAFLANGLNNPAWRRSVRSIALQSGAPGETGAVYSQTMTGPGGRSIQGDYRITASDPGRSLAFQVIAGPARPEGQYLLTESGDRTTVRFILDLKASGLMRVLDRFITKTMKAEVGQLQELKRVLEEA